MNEDRWLVRVAAAALLILVIVAAWRLTPILPDLDDAYISLHSAQSILAGGDPQYGTPPLTGITSPPYVLLLTLLLKTSLTPLVALRAASAIGLAALALSLWMLGRSLGLKVWQQLVLVIAVLISGPVVEQATNGVETGWAMALAIGLIAAAVAMRSTSTAIAAALLPWLRPDLLPMAGLLFLTVLWNQSWPRRFRAIAVAALVFVPWALWVHWDTGSWIPQTMAAKAAFFAESCQPISAKLRTVGGAIVALMLVFVPASVLAAAWVPRQSIGRIGLIACAVTIAAYTFTLPGGLWHNHQRYMYPIALPWIALGLAACIQDRRIVWRVALGIAFLLSLNLQSTKRWPNEGPERVAAATWINEHIDGHSKLMVHDAGVFSVFTSNPLVDLVGLKTPTSIDAHKSWTWPSCGADRSKAVAAIAQASSPEYLIVISDWDEAFSLTSGLRHEGFTLQELRAPPPEGNGYHVYRINQALGGSR